ncbi:hypothetical protein ASZ90_016161 [hydrocarbon metagenome]|uniref:Archaeal Type IV pilin N-terminal domain-containing protein n=1 Tax=hydrocarbon metagenome TaxID=938273 RepID=A0A0W8EZZ0_9ZZZZ
MKERDQGLSEVVGVILMVVLLIGIAIIVLTLIMGGTILQPKSAFVMSEVRMTEVTRGGVPVQLVTLQIREAEPFHFIGQTGNPGGARVQLKVTSPDGRVLLPDASGLSGPLTGRTLYIYPNSSRLSSQCDFVVSDRLPDGVLKDMMAGIWNIQLIDMDANILISSDSRARITKGSISYPRIEGSPGSGCIYRADCTLLCPGGNPGVNGTTGPPMNMTYLSFGGTNYVSYPHDPSLSYTGDLSISLWLRPDTLGSWTNSGSWMQVIGKGTLTGSSQEDKNYDLYLIGRRIYFEWDDKVTNTHYHIMTDGDAVTSTTDWSYIAMVVENREPVIYVNGVAQSFSYYQSNIPGQAPITNPALYPPVNLKENEHPLFMGRQQTPGPSNLFYYRGDIGNFALYNCGLTTSEIAENWNNYLA